MFLRNMASIAHRIAVVDGFDNKLTYGELEKISEDYKRCIPTRSLVMILCDYAIETIAFYYSQLSNESVPMLIDRKTKPDILLKIIETYRPQFIWCVSGTEEYLATVAAERICNAGNHLLIRLGFGRCEMDAGLALLLTTSGTTGSAKFVRLSYENLLFNIQAYVKKINICEESRGITTLPMHHCYGLSLLHMHWLVGASICVTDWSVLDVRFWDLLKKAGATNFAGVSYTYEMLKQIDFLENDYPSLSFVTQAGTKMNDAIKKEFSEGLRKKNVDFYICYGQTEASTFISCLSYEDSLKRPDSVGEPLLGIDTFIENPDERGVGELIVKGRTVSLGYAFGWEDLAQGDHNKGYLHTGDLVYTDEEGYLFIKGRKSRIVKLLGERISLDELETVLTLHFSGTEFVCSGEDDRIAVFFTGSRTEKEVLDFCRQQFSISGKLAVCCHIGELPRTGTGKVDYSELQRIANKIPNGR